MLNFFVDLDQSRKLPSAAMEFKNGIQFNGGLYAGIYISF
jgi:hypothetical protein